MFSAAVGGFNYASGPSGRLTVLVDSNTDIITLSNPYVPVIDSSYNLYLVYDYAPSGLDSTTLVKINSSGVLQYQQRLYDATNQRTGGGLSVNSATGNQYLGLYQSGGNQSFYGVNSAGGLLVNSQYRSSSGSENINFTIVDTTNSCVYYIFPSGNIIKSTSLTSLVPSTSSFTYLSVGTPTWFNGSMSGNFILLAGRNLNTNYYGVISVFAAPLTNSANGSAYLISRSGVNTVYNKIISDGTNVYASGYTTDPTGGIVRTGFVVNYTQNTSTGALTLAWYKTFTAIATNSEINAITQLPNGNVLLAFYNSSSSTVVSLVCLDSSGNIVWQNKITFTTTGATTFQPTQLASSSTSFYLYCDSIVSGSFATGAYFELPNNGTIPGSGTYTVAGKTYTYTSESKSFVTNTMTSTTDSSSGVTTTYALNTLSVTNAAYAGDTATTGTL